MLVVSMQFREIVEISTLVVEDSVGCLCYSLKINGTTKNYGFECNFPLKRKRSGVGEGGGFRLSSTDRVREESFLARIVRDADEREPLAGGHLNMTKPVLISQTNKRSPTVTPLNRGVGDAHYSPSTATRRGRGKERAKFRVLLLNAADTHGAGRKSGECCGRRGRA